MSTPQTIKIDPKAIKGWDMSWQRRDEGIETMKLLVHLRAGDGRAVEDAARAMDPVLIDAAGIIPGIDDCVFIAENMGIGTAPGRLVDVTVSFNEHTTSPRFKRVSKLVENA